MEAKKAPHRKKIEKRMKAKMRKAARVAEQLISERERHEQEAEDAVREHAEDIQYGWTGR